MNIVEKKVSELVEYEGNPRVNDDAVTPVAESIKSFGFKQPIVIDKHDVIVAGHTRYRAAIKLGLETVPCVVADDLTEDEVRAYRLVDNKTSEYALWDVGSLIKELSTIDFDLRGWAFEMPASEEIEIPAVPDVQGIEYKEKFGIVIDCPDELTQRQVYEFVTGGGYSARIVSI